MWLKLLNVFPVRTFSERKTDLRATSAEQTHVVTASVVRTNACVCLCVCTSVWGAGFTHTHTYTSRGLCVSDYMEEEKGRRLAFSLTLRSECSNITEQDLWATTSFLLGLFWSLFQINQNHSEKRSLVKVWTRKTCLQESTHTWRELFQILKVCHAFSYFPCSVAAFYGSLSNLSNGYLVWIISFVWTGLVWVCMEFYLC